MPLEKEEWLQGKETGRACIPKNGSGGIGTMPTFIPKNFGES